MSDSCQKVLITGATGYIGSQLATKLLKDGNNVNVVCRKKNLVDVLAKKESSIVIHEHDGSTENLIEIIKLANPEIIYHLASSFMVSHEPKDLRSLIDSNILFTTQLLEAMAINNVKKLINTGTSWQTYTESIEAPVNLYASTKKAAQNIVDYYAQANNLHVISLILFDTYGPRDNRGKLVSTLIKSAYMGTSLDMSPGEQMIDLVYIDDILTAFAHAPSLFNDKEWEHNKYSVATGIPLSIKEIVSVVEKITKRNIAIRWGARKYRQREIMIPFYEYPILPKWKTITTLDEGLNILNDTY